MKSKRRATLFAICCAILAMFCCACTPGCVSCVNNWEHSLRKADDATNYKTLKKVEDTARAMVSSYNTDKLTYETYASSEDKEEQSWAKQAKIRANATANSYNEYILKNSYVWSGNIPSDIKSELPIIE